MRLAMELSLRESRAEVPKSTAAPEKTVYEDIIFNFQAVEAVHPCLFKASQSCVHKLSDEKLVYRQDDYIE